MLRVFCHFFREYVSLEQALSNIVDPSGRIVLACCPALVSTVMSSVDKLLEKYVLVCQLTMATINTAAAFRKKR